MVGEFSLSSFKVRDFTSNYNWRVGLLKLQGPGEDPLNVFLILSDALQVADLLPQYLHLVVQLLSSCTPPTGQKIMCPSLSGMLDPL